FRAENFCRFKVRWNENAGFKAVARSLGRCGISQISRGRTAHNFKSERARLRKGDCYDTVFETESGKADGIVLQVERLGAERFAQVGCLHQWRESDRQRSIVLLRQWKKFFVPPQVGRPAGNLIATDQLSDLIQVINYFKRRKAVFTIGNRLVAPRCAALATLQLIW